MLIRGLPTNALFQLLTSLSRLPTGSKHVFLCLADHYEPDVGRASAFLQSERVARWLHDYPVAVAGLHDSVGRSPQHTFFYPVETYNAEHLDALAELCHAGHGDVEVHLHHDRDNSAHLREVLLQSVETLHNRHGLLRRDELGRIQYAFIHGNWALDNSHPCGRFCGVNDELTILRETGCYADMTMPSAPAPAQTRTINSIYYAVDDTQRPKSHDVGTPARAGIEPPDESLLMIQGPLQVNWRQRKAGLLPRLENGELHGGHPPTLERLALWLRARVQVSGRPDWFFVKLHTHGALERNANMLLGPAMRSFHEQLAAYAEQNQELRYYYVTAHEMAELVHQAEQGVEAPRLPIVTSSLSAIGLSH